MMLINALRGIITRAHLRWLKFLLRHSGSGLIGRFIGRVACLGTIPFHHRAYFAELNPNGFAAPSAVLSHPNIHLGKHVYLGDRLLITKNIAGGTVRISDRVHLYGESSLETGLSAKISIGDGAHIQPGCRIHAFVSDITIGRKVEIAPNCAFYSYDHGMAAGKPIMDQPLVSKGGIEIGDGAWIGHGVTVLQNVHIGRGAVIGAGAVVTNDIPENTIAAGVPAVVIGARSGAQRFENAKRFEGKVVTPA